MNTNEQATDVGLTALDKQLEEGIKRMRENKDNNNTLEYFPLARRGSNMKDDSLLSRFEARTHRAKSTGRASLLHDSTALNKHLQNSRSSNVSKLMVNPDGSGRKIRIIHEDPAAEMCIDEKQWFNIVQENYKKFNDERQKAQELKLQKA